MIIISVVIKSTTGTSSYLVRGMPMSSSSKGGLLIGVEVLFTVIDILISITLIYTSQKSLVVK